MRYSVVAVGKAKAPYLDDLQHYGKLLSRYARVDVIEVADDEALQRRIPERAWVCLLDSRGKAYTSEAFAGWLEERRQAGRDVCFVIGGAFGTELERADQSCRSDPRRFRTCSPGWCSSSSSIARTRSWPVSRTTTSQVPVHPCTRSTSCGRPSRRPRATCATATRAPKARASLERPKKAGFGDYSTNAAMLLAPALGAPPREIAERLGAKLTARLGDAVDHVEVAGPASSTSSWPTPGTSARRGRSSRRATAGAGATPEHPEKVIVEFVSANPTGPLTAASGRHAAYGDALARLLELSGHSVTREYYFNNAGSQVTKLGASVRARARHEPVPEDGYQGDYVAELAARIPGAADKDAEALGALGVAR